MFGLYLNSDEKAMIKVFLIGKFFITSMLLVLLIVFIIVASITIYMNDRQCKSAFGSDYKQVAGKRDDEDHVHTYCGNGSGQLRELFESIK